MTFISELQEDFATVFCDPMEFGESIVYIAKRSDYIESTAAPGSGDKNISARVSRNEPNPQRDDIDTDFPVNGVRFYISKDPTSGITSVSVNQDKIKAPIKLGGTIVVMIVSKILSETIAMWHLEARQ